MLSFEMRFTSRSAIDSKANVQTQQQHKQDQCYFKQTVKRSMRNV